MTPKSIANQHSGHLWLAYGVLAFAIVACTPNTELVEIFKKASSEQEIGPYVVDVTAPVSVLLLRSPTESVAVAVLEEAGFRSFTKEPIIFNESDDDGTQSSYYLGFYRNESWLSLAKYKIYIVELGVTEGVIDYIRAYITEEGVL